MGGSKKAAQYICKVLRDSYIYLAGRWGRITFGTISYDEAYDTCISLY